MLPVPRPRHILTVCVFDIVGITIATPATGAEGAAAPAPAGAPPEVGAEENFDDMEWFSEWREENLENMDVEERPVEEQRRREEEMYFVNAGNQLAATAAPAAAPAAAESASAYYLLSSSSTSGYCGRLQY